MAAAKTGGCMTRAKAVACLVVLGLAIAVTRVDAGMADELNSLPMGFIIGNPLMSCVRAQQYSAAATLAYLNRVAFAENENHEKHAKYFKIGFNSQDEFGNDYQSSIEVPVLSIVPVPFLALTSLTIEFKMSVQSQTKVFSSSKLGLDVTGTSPMTSPMFMQGSLSVGVTGSTGYNHQRSHDLSIMVTGGTDPANMEGLNMILDTLMEFAVMEM